MIFAAAGVGNLDADARPSGQALDADRLGRERERQVFREPHDLVDLDARRRPELVRRDDGPGVILGDLPFHVELGTLRGDLPARLGERLPVDGLAVRPLLQKRNGRIRVARDRQRQALLGVLLGLLLRRRRGPGRLRAGGSRRRRHGRLADRELPRAGELAHDGRSVFGGERNLIERDVVFLGPLEVLRDDRPAQAFLGPPVPLAGPSHRQARDEARESDPELQEDVAQRDLGRQRHGEEHERGGDEHGARRPDASPEDVGESPADDPAGLGFFAIQLAPSEGQREKHRQGKEEEPDPRGLGGRIRQRPSPEPSPTQHQNQAGDAPGRQAEEGVERGGQRGAETADPVVGVGRLSARGPGKDVGIAGVEGQQRQRREKAREQQDDTDRLTGEAALPEGPFAQSVPL